MTPTPHALWLEARAEHPRDEDARRARYLALMVEHGHVIPRTEGEDGNLPCGWPGSLSGRHMERES